MKWLLYHTKNYEGTTTDLPAGGLYKPLYHTKNYEGTTTSGIMIHPVLQLYHTKNYEGTTTERYQCLINHIIIPYQELRGNYNGMFKRLLSARLYHTKNYEGTTTLGLRLRLGL